MIADDFDRVLEGTLEHIRKVLASKGEEYATEDRLHNFKTAAILSGVSPRAALGGMMAKHTVSVYDLIHDAKLADMTIWDEKIIDHINYLILLRAVVTEEHRERLIVEHDESPLEFI